MIPVIFLWKFCQIITQKQRKTAHFKETSGLTWYAALEQDAAKHGFTKAILETARTTEDSAALYTKLGYRVIPYYGSPAGAENCLCFEKNLGD